MADFGDANTLATAKNNAVNGLEAAGILHSVRGKVRLLRPEELDKEWDPATDDCLRGHFLTLPSPRHL